MGFFGKLRNWRNSKRNETQQVQIRSEQSSGGGSPQQKDEFHDEEGAEPTTRYSKMFDRRNSRRGTKDDNNNADGLQTNDHGKAPTSKNKAWLWLEHAFFFAGSLLLLISCSVELHTSKKWRGTPDDDNSYGDDVFARAVVGPWGWFSVLHIFASFCFLIHAMLYFILPNLNNNNNPNAAATIPVVSDDEEDAREMRRDAKTCGMIFFGLGALFYTISCFLEVEDEITREYVYEDAFEMTYMVATHFYFLSSGCFLFARSRQLVTFPLEMDHVKAVVVADCLFVLATFLPLLLYYIEPEEDTYQNWLVASRWYLSSAVLWLLVGILYLVSVAHTP